MSRVTSLEYLLELKEQLENEIRIGKSRIEFREKRLKILNDLIKKEQQELLQKCNYENIDNIANNIAEKLEKVFTQI